MLKIKIQTATLILAAAMWTIIIAIEWNKPPYPIDLACPCQPPIWVRAVPSLPEPQIMLGIIGVARVNPLQAIEIQCAIEGCRVRPRRS